VCVRLEADSEMKAGHAANQSTELTGDLKWTIVPGRPAINDDQCRCHAPST